MIVFDFDKTLTYKDTLFGFYKEVDGNNKWFIIKRFGLIISAFSYKAGLISNTQLKEIGVWLFLKGYDRTDIENAAIRYAKKIELSKLYITHFQPLSLNEKIICSASFEEYLCKVFPSEKVFGSRLSYIKNIVSGLEINLYADNKIRVLKNAGFSKFNAVYTDSKSDSCLIKYSESAFMVIEGTINQIK